MDEVPFFRNEREAIVTAAEDALHGRYEAEGAEERRHRLEALYDLIVDSVERRELGLLLANTRTLARLRFDAGYDLSDVQTAFHVLEEAIWRRIFKVLAPEEWREVLSLVATAFGAAKDALGCEWVSLATDAHVPSLDVRALFAGTERALTL